MKPFKHCASCGTRLNDPDEHGGLKCPGCDRTWHPPYAPTAGAAIVRDGKVLVTVRARSPKKGCYDIPGGFLNPGEDPIDGLKRELREELGIEIDASVSTCLQMAPHTYGEEDDDVLAIGFAARFVSGEPQPSDDVAEFRWVAADELDELDFAWEHDRRLAKRAVEMGGPSVPEE